MSSVELQDPQLSDSGEGKENVQNIPAEIVAKPVKHLLDRATFKITDVDSDVPLPWESEDDENDPLGLLSSDLDVPKQSDGKNTGERCISGFDDLLSDGEDLSDVSSLSSCPSSPLSECSYYSNSGEPEVRKKRKYTRRVPKVVKPEVELFKEYVETDAPDIDSYPLKSYLEAGLYSTKNPDESFAAIDDNDNVEEQAAADADTEDEIMLGRKRLRNSENIGQKIRKKIGKLLPLPVNLGQWYLSQQIDFSLPYDIIFEYDNRLINSNRQPPYYEKIRTNLYVERKKCYKINEHPCDCVPPKDGGMGCDEDCINRCMFYECSIKNCPCGEKCSNRAFQTKAGLKEPQMQVFYAGANRGFGLMSLVDLKKGQLVIEYRGEVISNETAAERMETEYKDAKCFYFLDYGNGEVLDGGKKGNEARFVNHSCDPNCHIEKWNVDGEICVGLFASRDIKARTELTYDYNFHNFSENKKQKCGCGSANCRGILGKSSEMVKIVKPSSPKRRGRKGKNADIDHFDVSLIFRKLGDIRKRVSNEYLQSLQTIDPEGGESHPYMIRNIKGSYKPGQYKRTIRPRQFKPMKPLKSLFEL